MANRFDPLEKITPVRECWRVKVRIVRLWYLPAFNNSNSINSIEMVLMDDFGTAIHTSVRKTLIYKFKPLLSEGQVYVLAFFGVGGNTGLFRSTRHEFRLNFQLRTTVRPSESDLIPLYGCKFVPFDEILQADGNFPFLVDVIGVLTVVGTEKEYDKDGRKLRMIVIELEADSLKIDIALFGDFVDEVSKFLSIGDVQRPIVVVQYAKLKTFKGKIVLQNVMYGTRILFNPDIPEALSLKKSLPPPEDDNSQILTIIPDSQSYSVEDDFLRATSRKSIEQLKDCKDDGFYVVLATVKGVNRGSDWWYTACKCNKAVTADSGMYYCDRCYRHVVNVVPRYKIKVRVMDDTDSTTFVIWDRDGCNILKKSCYELLESIHKGAGPVGFPVEFDEHMINKNFLFKVEVKSSIKSQFEPSYRVNRMSNDEDIITKFKESDPSFMAVEPDLTAGMSLGDTTFSLEFQDIQSSVSKDSMIQFSEDNLTLGSQADVNILSETPVKFSSNDVGCALEGDMSTTKLNKESWIQDSEDDFTLGSQADVNILSETPVKCCLNDVGSSLEGDLSITKLKKVKLEHE